MAGRVEEINTDILQKCREQAGLDLPDVEKKVSKIAEIEAGTHSPTFKQLDTLSKLYSVPRWVFISEQLPTRYQFDKSVLVFRQFAAQRAEIFDNSKVRRLIARVERFRDLILELLDDMGETFTKFEPPKFNENINPESAAQLIRSWLGLTDDHLDFPGWKRLMEDKGVFVFLTSKYKGWSHIDNMLVRGMSIYHTIMPILIINDSDVKKAQSFTLFHELGHLLQKESTIDDWEFPRQREEKWCDEFAGNVLMPSTMFNFTRDEIKDLDTVKNIAKTFKVSFYACLVRLRQLSIIDQTTYTAFETQLKNEYAKMQKKLKESPGGPARNRSLEVLNQFGRIYTRVLFQAYHNKEIGLHKLMQFFDLKKPSYVFDLEVQL
ncbi:ImmA/IrrE family metallo-endopeptidase [candidate division CSSED10-310 bacterium]|uniref:ImmA/IrrE family metallo-endopeptidase n=1 Tax=candidate division CSSED10-310 bacterium TaxID=2855610 RepID=A0ABV6YSD2_UNCC1